jgi:hypothetical protein
MRTADTVLMVSPTHFGFNEQTANSNGFQHNIITSLDETRARALAEFAGVKQTLEKNGINVLCLESPVENTPDAIFPNNWLSTHIVKGKHYLYIYPMLCENRRHEIQLEALLLLLKKFAPERTYEVIDLRADFPAILEGTGALIFDHQHQVGFVSLSERAELGLAQQVLAQLNYELVSFSSYDKKANKIYHTNVMLSIGEQLAFVCLEAISAEDERAKVKEKLLAMNKTLIELTLAQIYCMAGNVVELKNKQGKQFLLLSTTADNSLTVTQKKMIEQYCVRLACDVSHIETISGGSVRCMLAEIF